VSQQQDNAGVSRRRLLAGVTATAVASLAAGAAALPRSRVDAWDIYTDVLVIGSGAAGVCAALEARAAGARVLLIESEARFGGSSAMSGGVVYAGGGTALQRALGVEDSVGAMYDFIVGAGSRHPELDKIQLYCEQSPAHFDWLVAQGIPYQTKFSAARGLPRGEESLYFSGNEQAWPARELARPAPRGHVPAPAGSRGGDVFMQALLQQARAVRVGLQANAVGEQLVVEGDGRIAGAIISVAGERRAVRVLRGVVLACGGFIHNREMLRRHAPELYDCSAPWGSAGDLGGGINMGIAAGAASQRMHQGCAFMPIYPPDALLSGVVVNASGQRFISEESYHGVLGDAIAYHQGGRAWLITDHNSSPADSQENFRQVAQASTFGDLATQLGLPRGSLQNTLAYYNRHAFNGEDPLFQKQRPWLRPLQGPPYKAWDLSVDQAFCPAHTLGGLRTTVDGEVLDSAGELIPGLFAAGRTAAGLPGAPYAASGLSVGDCTFFGRRAGRRVAATA
jgi:3-oxo-5alpha-steroid 4-dehydrogenase